MGGSSCFQPDPERMQKITDRPSDEEPSWFGFHHKWIDEMDKLGINLDFPMCTGNRRRLAFWPTAEEQIHTNSLRRMARWRKYPQNDMDSITAYEQRTGKNVKTKPLRQCTAC